MKTKTLCIIITECDSLQYLYVRIIGHRLYKKDLDLSNNEILEANQNV